MNKHTPGPWYLPYSDDCADYTIYSKDGLSICKWHTNKENEAVDIANAHLISAAPNLLAACEIANNRMLDWDMMDRDAAIRLLQNWRGKCFKAIAKAKGK